MSKKLRQCMSCPWRKGVEPKQDIPNYSLGMHRDLGKSTIAREGDDMFTRNLHVMACHKSKEGRETTERVKEVCAQVRCRDGGVRVLTVRAEVQFS